MSRQTAGFALTALVAAAVTVDVGGQAPRTFTPDWTFKGSGADRHAAARCGHVAGRERRDHRHADRTRRRLAAARQGIPGRAVRGVVPLRCRVHGGRHGAIREGRGRDPRRLYADLRRRAIDGCGHGRCAGEDHRSRTADAQCRRAGPVRAAASGSRRRPGGRRWRSWRSGRTRRTRRSRSDGIRFDVRASAGSCRQRQRLEPGRSARRRRRLPLERQRARQLRSRSTAPPETSGRLRCMSEALARPGSRTSRSRTSRAASRRPSRPRRGSARSSSRTSITAGQPPRATSTTTASST